MTPDFCPFCGGYHAPVVTDSNGLAAKSDLSASSDSLIISSVDPSSSTSPASLPSYEAQTLILGGNYMWNVPASAGTPMVVTYSFMTQVPAYETLYYTSGAAGFQAFNATQQNAARAALAAWENVSGVTFVEVPDSLGGDIRFGMHTMNTGVGGYAFYPNTNGNSALDSGGDIFLNNYYLGADPLSFGTYGFFALLHEIGHTLGLKHPFDGSPTLPSWLDNTNNTVMSYTVTGYPNQPQNYDVQAIQYLYGSRAAANSDAITTIWDASNYLLGTIGSASGETLIGVNVADRLYGQGGNDTIYARAGNDMLDGGAGADLLYGGDGDDQFILRADGDIVNGETGADSVDYSYATAAVYVDLASSVGRLLAGGVNDTLANVEDVAGSSFDDDLRGNLGGNVLRGGAGADTLAGDDGNDTLDGGAGADSMNGGTGNDSYIVDDGGDTITDASGTDTVSSWITYTLGNGLENIVLLSGTTSSYGNALDNRMVGSDAANVLRGDGGADTLYGGGGNDWLEGETGNTPFGGVAGADIIYCEAGNDTVLGGDGGDFIDGGSGTDILVGEGGADIIYGGSEWDAVDGRDGNDQLYGQTGADIIFGDDDDDTIWGGDGDDLIMGERGYADAMLIGNDTIYGEAGNDLLDGSEGNDTIYGGIGNDIIDGDHGDDIIVGGVGAEIIAGSDYNGVTGHDTFYYFALDEGGDSIYGFRTTPGNNDRIGLQYVFDGLGYAGTNPRGDGYLLLQESGGSTYVYVDGNGPAGGGNWTPLVTLVGTSLSAGGQAVDNYFIYQ